MAKAKRKVYHVTPKSGGGGWVVKAEGAKGLSASLKSKPAAVARAKALAVNARGAVVVHKADGKVLDRMTFDAPKPAAKKAKPAAKKARPAAKRAKPAAKKAKPAAKKARPAAKRAKPAAKKGKPAAKKARPAAKKTKAVRRKKR